MSNYGIPCYTGYFLNLWIQIYSGPKGTQGLPLLENNVINVQFFIEKVMNALAGSPRHLNDQCTLMGRAFHKCTSVNHSLTIQGKRLPNRNVSTYSHRQLKNMTTNTFKQNNIW